MDCTYFDPSGHIIGFMYSSRHTNFSGVYESVTIIDIVFYLLIFERVINTQVYLLDPLS